ncbi:MAG: phosphate/phosphite/phosphonate ABC transporter substrate-binding protein [Patescibacteria group bacterium]|nr:phosphate/phosphite/phosphonate ABC transporter substrate-binding protein [Patescibacteria group bacterium]
MDEENTINNYEYEEEPEQDPKKWILGGVVVLAIIILIATLVFFVTKEELVEPVIPVIPVGEEEEENVIYMGILPLQNPTEMLNRFGALENYLNEYTDLNIKMKFYPTKGELGGYSAVTKDFVEGDIELVYLAPVTTIQAYGNIGDDMEILACGERCTGSPTYQGDLLVLEDSPYQSIWDLEGKKVTGTSVSSTSGNLMPSAMFIEEGIDSDTFFDGGMQYIGSHDKAVEALLKGVVEGAFVNEKIMEKFLENDAPIRSIWRHAPVPEFPILANKSVLSEEQIEEVRSALLSSVEVDPLIHERIDANYNRFVAISIEDYLPLKKAIDAVHGETFYDLDVWGK